jgi:glycosyltransferase involved in cell wall biosynthesis
MSRPRFSIVIPVFNAQLHLRTSLDSVIAAIKEYGNAELILLDNGSEDGSYRILKEEYGSWHVDQFRDLTIAGLRNAGARLANGEYLSFIDSDCVVPPNYLDEALRVFTSVGPDVTGSMCALPDTTGWVERSWRTLHERSTDGYVNYLNSGNLVIKRTVFAQVGGFNESLVTGEDTDLAQRLRRSGFIIYECHKVRAVHLGYSPTLRQFMRRQAWYSQGMFGEGIRKSTLTLFLYLAFVLVGVIALYLVRTAPVVAMATFLVLVNLVPTLAVGYRVNRLGRMISPFPGLFLYHCFYVGRLWGLMRIATGNAARTYRKQ